jgi:glycosidase
MAIRTWGLICAAFLISCSEGGGSDPGTDDEELRNIFGKADWTGNTPPIEPLNQAAGDMIVYEIQVRSANACRLSTGGETCSSMPRPSFSYHGEGCDVLSDLQDIRKSTFDDLLATDPEPDRTRGITLQYVDEVVAANTVWFMPFFPHNFQYNLPDRCDDLGSPYAVRDYFHTRGTLAARCIAAGRDEWSDTPCWGDTEFDKVVDAAHGRGMKVMLDLAFNHLGHEYLFYDYADAAVPVRTMLEQRKNLWDFDATYDPALVHPAVLDDPAALADEAWATLSVLCDDLPKGQEAVRRWLLWREAFDHERQAMSCARPATLENQVPGFYLGADANNPSRKVGDNFTNNWPDVKFLYNNEANVSHGWEFARTREYAFRVINFWLSKGVDGFRLDHANGLTENEWRYIFRKAKFYQAKRGMPTPVFLSESFHDIEQLNRVFDVLTEGYHHDISHGLRNAKDLEDRLFVNRDAYLGFLSFILLNLENHDEGRLLKPSTGFDIWRGATFYALAAASRGTLMLLAGQEWGEPWDLGFRRSDYLRGRFPNEALYSSKGDSLTLLYRAIHEARLSPANVALRKGEKYFLRMENGQPKDQLFAMVRHMKDCSNTIFTFFRLWVDDVEASFVVDSDLAGKICLADDVQYRLVDAFTGKNVWETSYPGGARSGKHIREFGVYVHLDLGTSFQYLRLERR